MTAPWFMNAVPQFLHFLGPDAASRHAARRCLRGTDTPVCALSNKQSTPRLARPRYRSILPPHWAQPPKTPRAVILSEVPRALLSTLSSGGAGRSRMDLSSFARGKPREILLAKTGPSG